MDLGKVFLPQFSNDKVAVFSVNGFYVRSNLYLDFTEGGNDQVYGGGDLSHADFIPPGEVWLDDGNRVEFIFIAIHELRERRAMLDRIDYETAHQDYANKLEQEARDSPEKAWDILKGELAAQPATASVYA